MAFFRRRLPTPREGSWRKKLIPEALKQRGYIEGGNLVIEWRWANGKIADLPALAAELVRNKVEIIVARTNLPIQAAMKATKTIPIVMLNGNFPVEVGLVNSLAHPGGNVTGTSYWPSADDLWEALSNPQGAGATHRSRRFAAERKFHR